MFAPFYMRLHFVFCLSKADSGGFCSPRRVACHAGTSCRGRVARGPLERPAAVGSLERGKVEFPAVEKLQAGSCFTRGCRRNCGQVFPGGTV